MCVPSPLAMNEPVNGWRSTVPRTLMRPRVPKNSTDSGHTTNVHPPLVGLFCNLAVKSFLTFSSVPTAHVPRESGATATEHPLRGSCLLRIDCFPRTHIRGGQLAPSPGEESI